MLELSSAVSSRASNEGYAEKAPYPGVLDNIYDSCYLHDHVDLVSVVRILLPSEHGGLLHAAEDGVADVNLGASVTID